jgi:hypothetical protein
MVQLMRWGTEMGLDDALRVIFGPGYDPETASMEDPAVEKVLSFGETVGALVKHGLLDRDLLLDIFWVDGVWSKVGQHAHKAREHEGEPSLYENFEALALARKVPGVLGGV